MKFSELSNIWAEVGYLVVTLTFANLHILIRVNILNILIN